jgi:nucleoside-diphosphate-sugar epimerase
LHNLTFIGRIENSQFIVTWCKENKLSKRIVVIGGAGYIGSMLVSILLDQGNHVTVIDNLLFGGEPLLPFLPFQQFNLVKEDICTSRNLDEKIRGADAVVHLAALVGFPACDRAGREMTWRINVEGTQRVYKSAMRAGVKRFVYASSYSNYGRAEGDTMVNEESPLFPQSLYAESKIAAERFLLEQASQSTTSPTCLRLATVFGVSPRTRFDLMVNQFTLEAFLKRRLVIFQQDFKRSFVHVRDVARAVSVVVDAPENLVRGQVFNIGSEKLNTTKSFLVKVLQKHWPDVQLELRDANFGGDMRSLHVSFEKARRALGFEARLSLEEGINELCWILENNVIQEPQSNRYRNHPAIIV